MPTTAAPSSAFVVLAVCVCATAAPSQVFNWTQASPTANPGARRYATLAGDDQRQEVLLFGGYANAWLGDTWTWNGSQWTQRNPATSPPARENDAMAYDAARQRVVLFGGNTGVYGPVLADTWEWDGNGWQQCLPIVAPSARRGHTMSYDPARQVVVLFGGFDLTSHLDDTWEWNGTIWTQITPVSAPPPRQEHAMAFDAVRQHVLLFGGATPAVLGDVWEWTGAAWLPVFATSYPPPRARSRMVCDNARQRVVLFGGAFGSTFYADTWEWDGTNWTLKAATQSPGARDVHGMAYDAARQQVVVFGGGNPGYLGDTWLSASAGATQYGAGCGAPPLEFVPDARPILGQSCSATIANAPFPAGGVAMGWSRDYSGPFALPVTLAGIGMTGCDLWQSAELIGLTVTPLTPTTMSFGFALPSQTTYVGTHTYLQAFALAPNQNPAWIIVSNAIDWRLGAF